MQKKFLLRIIVGIMAFSLLTFGSITPTADAAAAGGGSTLNAQSSTINKEVQNEAVSALTMLGFSPAPTNKVVLQILHDDPEAPVEKVIKLALKML